MGDPDLPVLFVIVKPYHLLNYNLSKLSELQLVAKVNIVAVTSCLVCLLHETFLLC